MPCVIHINEASNRPKYEQIVHSIVHGIESNVIRADERLPSINEVSEQYDIARDTVEKAYKELKRRGIIVSVPGKGYYKKEGGLHSQYRVMFLAPEMSMQVRQITDAMQETLGEQVLINFIAYGNCFQTFKRMMAAHQDNVSHIAVVPNFGLDEEQAKSLLNQVPKHKLIVLDRKISGIVGAFTCIAHNWEKEIYDALSAMSRQIGRFTALKLVCPSNSHILKDILRGFQRFCVDLNKVGKLVVRMETETVSEGDFYLVLKDEDLLALSKKLDGAGLKPKTDVGIMAINDNAVKEVLLNGISVLGPNYSYLGERMAQMIRKDATIQEECPCYFLQRGSL
jgi:DNA-binding transcriptional regulator YhcF (GntR family)